jgi:opacity protein-like surface antigen
LVRDEYEGHQHCYLQCVAYAVETYSVKTKWTGTATVTIGVARDRWLFYTKAGAAWADDSYGLGVTGVSNLTIPATGFNITTTSVNKIIGGWTVGTGVKWAFADNWFVNLEYNYLDFGSKAQNINGTCSFANPSFNSLCPAVSFNPTRHSISIFLRSNSV